MHVDSVKCANLNIWHCMWLVKCAAIYNITAYSSAFELVGYIM